MRVLVSFIGGLGHFHPLEPLARAAQARGHEVVVACSGGLTGRVEDAGFTALPTSAPRAAGAAPTVRAALEPVDARAAEVEFAENFADKGARRHLAAVGEHLRSWRPDVLVRDEADLGAGLAAELAGVPAATVLVLAAGTLVRPELVGPRLAAIRAEVGLKPDPGLAGVLGPHVLSPVPPSFRDPDAPVPLPVGTTWFRDVVPVRSTRAPGSRPRVYATLGTVFNSESGDLLERLVAGLGDVDADVLLTVGRDLDPADLGPLPAHVRAERWVPQAEALAHADLVVSHGGSGTLVAALAHGVPSVLLPLGADQPHNAARATELGLATTLDAAACSASELDDAVGAALADDPMAGRARDIAGEMANLPPVEEAMIRLEELARG